MHILQSTLAQNDVKSLTVLIMLFDLILDLIWFYSLLQPDIQSAKLHWHCSVDSVYSCYKVRNEI